MAPSYPFPFHVSLIGMVVIGLIIAFIAAAMVGAGRFPRALAWIGVIGLVLVMLLFGVRSIAPHAPQVAWGEPQVHVTRSWGFSFFVLLVPFVAFLVSRLAARPRGGDVEGSRSGSPWSWLAAGAACFVIFGGIWGARSTHYSVQRTPRIEPAQIGHGIPGEIDQHGTVPSHEPLDELWERLNASQIPVSTSTTSDLTKAEVDQADEAEESAPESSLTAEAEDNNAESADESSEAVVAEATPVETKYVDAPPFTGSEAKMAAPPRPDWVAQPPRMVGGVQRVVLQAGPYTSLEECYTQLRRELREAVADHIGELVREATANASPYVPELALMGITDGYMIRELLTDQYVEDVEASFGLTKTAWGLVEFSETQDVHLLNAWRNYARRDRIKYTVLLAVGTVSVLGALFALLKIDTWTRGYYTKRLFLGVPAAIIGLMILAGLVGV
jgi:hypothetical protein